MKRKLLLTKFSKKCKVNTTIERYACLVGVISREFIEKLELNDQEVLIVDTEAGIEHFGRGIEIASKAWELAQKLRKDVYLILNKVPEEEVREKVKKLREEKGLKPVGIIPYDEKVFMVSLEGKSPPLGKAYQSVKNTIEHILSRA